MNGIAKWNLLLEPVEAEVRRTFRFRRHIEEAARQRLTRIGADYKRRWREKRKGRCQTKCASPKVTFVGIHIRRTDAQHNYVKRFNLPDLGASYYLAAIDLFREKFKHAGMRRIFF